MKWLFGLLLLINLVFVSFMQWGAILTDDSKNLQSLPPLNADKIKLLAASAVPSATVPLPAVAVTMSQVQPVGVPACMEWGEFSGGDLSRAHSALDALKLGEKLAQRQIEYTIGYWAFIPPSKTRAGVDKKIAELKEHGIEDYFIVQESGKWHNAISLGVFKTDEAAHKFLESIRAKGIKAAVVGERSSKLKFTVFMLKNLDAAVLAKVTALHKEFSGSELKPVACGQPSGQNVAGQN